MISGGELSRRLIIFMEALWEAREKIFELSERGIDREELDWFERESFDEDMDRHRHALRVRGELDLQAAYDSEAVHVTCTNEERSEALRLAFDIFEGNVTPERGVDRLVSEGFPHDVSDS